MGKSGGSQEPGKILLISKFTKLSPNTHTSLPCYGPYRGIHSTTIHNSTIRSMHCKIMILMGKTDPNASRSKQQSMILVPMDTPGITLLRPMSVIGDEEAPKGHMEILFEGGCLFSDGEYLSCVKHVSYQMSTFRCQGSF